MLSCKVNSSKYTTLKNGSILFPDGTLWEGTLSNFEWCKTGQHPSEFILIGKVTQIVKSSEESKGVKVTKSGIWKCLDTGREYKLLQKMG